MRIRIPLAALGCTALSLACGGKDTPSDTAAAAAPPPPAAAPVSTIDALKGRWSVRSVPAQGDTTPTLATMDLSGDTASWTMSFPNRPAPVKLHVLSAAGDSAVVESDVYESVRRKGMQVHTSMVLRMQDGRVTGTTTAHYHTKSADSVLVLRSEGTRAP